MREVGQLDGVDPGVRDLVLDGERDGARAGAEVDDEGRVTGGERGLDRQTGDDLGLGARHEDARSDDEGEPAEVRPAGQVLEGDAGEALLDEAVVRVEEPGVGRDPQDHPAPHVRGIGPEGERGELDGIRVGRRDALVGERRAGERDRRVDGGTRDAHRSAIAARRAASSASTADWMIGSRSPSRTASRLYALNPVRWSLIRFSG